MKRSVPNSAFLLAVGFIVPAIASRSARSLSRKLYEAATDKQAPLNPAARDVKWGEAMLWAAGAGAIGGLARVTARRFLAETSVPTSGDDFDENLVELQESVS